jgi:transposase
VARRGWTSPRRGHCGGQAATPDRAPPREIGRAAYDQKAHRRRRGSSGGRPVSYDKNAYRGRIVIERAFNGFKHWRGLATRYDKHAVVYRGGPVLAAALIWLAD